MRKDAFGYNRLLEFAYSTLPFDLATPAQMQCAFTAFRTPPN
jgi:hypothetical protein